MTFSIIIPYFYKYDSFFEDCFSSVFKQSFCDYECIIVYSNEEIKYLERHLPFDGDKVKLVPCDKLDQSNKRNCGIEVASGQYIIFVDCDDILDSRFLEHGKEDIKKYNPDLIAYGFTRDYSEIGVLTESSLLISGENNCRFEIYSDYMLEKQNISNIVFDSSCWKVFKREIIDNEHIRFRDGLKCAEDAVFVRSYSLHVKSLVVNNSYNSYYWRINSISTMNDVYSGFFDIEPFFTSLSITLAKLPYNFYSNIDNYFNSIIISRINFALSLSKKGNYPLFVLICMYKNSKYIKNTIKLSLFKGRFYKVVALSIKYNLFVFFKPLLKSFLDKKHN